MSDEGTMIDKARAWDAISEKNAELTRLRAQNAEMLAALKECGADWSSSPGTVMSAQIEINQEFQRRLNIAATAVLAAERDQ